MSTSTETKLRLPDLPLPEGDVVEGLASVKHHLVAAETPAKSGQSVSRAGDQLADVITWEDVEAQREWLLDLHVVIREVLEAQARADAARVFNADPLLQAAEQVRVFFDNDPESTGVFVAAVEDPYGQLKSVARQLEPHGNFITLATTDPLTSRWEDIVAAAKEPDRAKRRKKLAMASAKAERAAKGLAELFNKGIAVQLLATLPPGSYSLVSQAMTALESAQSPLLSSAAGWEQIKTFIGQTADPEQDPDLACPATPIGAILGRRSVLDRKFGVAEPDMGDRGGKGVLHAGVLLDPWLSDDRDNVVACGVNPMREWGGVAKVVLDGDRTLLSGVGEAGEDSVYVYASRVRLKLWIASIFYQTVDHELYGDGGGPEGRLDAACTAMNVFLNWLKAQRWITEGSVTVDRDANDLKLDVNLGMDPVHDQITLAFNEIKKAREK